MQSQQSNPDLKELNRDVWVLRIAGIVFLALGWLVISIPDFGSAEFAFDTGALSGLAIYAFIAARRGRTISVNLERKLRLSLLVHNVELENMAMRDDLTKLFNRRYLFERLDRELETAKGFQRPLAVVVIDLDCMKTVNDTYGHIVGDRLLEGFGRFLLDQARGSDVPARTGGDEFAIILPDTTEDGARIVVDRLQQALAKADLLDDNSARISLTASFGVSGYPWGSDDVDTIMQTADASMYVHKRTQKANGGGMPETAIPAVNGTIPEEFRRPSDDAVAAEPQAEPHHARRSSRDR